ncbi:hypothetical protein CR513_12946, partial [Mucuna pruriens]
MCRPHHLTSIALIGGRRITSLLHGALLNSSHEDQGLELKGHPHSMIMTLKLGLFSNNLYKRPPTSMDELRAKASKYIQMEEMVEFRDSIRAEHQKMMNR